MKNNSFLIKVFNAALVNNSCALSFAHVNEYANKIGYLVHPDVCNQDVFDFLKETEINYNSTFYKTWEDVTSKSRFELYIDQAMHYCTTYDTYFALGNGYVPNDNEHETFNFEKYKVIMPISEAEMYKRCLKMIYAGIALKEDTLNAICDYIIEYIKETPDAIIDIDAIKNREAQVLICTKLNMYPKDKFGLLRYIIYVTTGKTMIIKDANMLNSIKNSEHPFDFNTLAEDGMKAIASIFLRYKDIILAFKHNSNVNNVTVINKLRKMAKVYHEPMKQGFWQTIFSEEKTAEEIAAEADKLDNFKKVAIMQTCISRSAALNNQLYIVRNQKMYLRKNYKPVSSIEYCMMVYSILNMSLVNSMKASSTIKTVVKDTKTGEIISESARPKIVRMNSKYDIALPTSEKSFIGNYPFGTKFKMSENNIIGIYWRNEWGTYDFDLSMTDETGNRISWNSDFYTAEKDIIYSGDMTNAEPEATELLYIKNTCPSGVIRVNQFNGQNISKFKFFVAQEDLSKLSKDGLYGYMCNPNSVIFETEVPVVNQREQQIAVINNNEIILMAIGAGNRRISSCNSYAKLISDSFMHKSQCFIQSRDVLVAAGYTVVDENYQGDVDIDFTCMDKDTIISMMS